MGILCDACRRFPWVETLKLHPKKPDSENESISVTNNACPLRPLLGVEAHDYGTHPFPPELIDYDHEILIYTGVEGSKEVILRRSRDVFGVPNRNFSIRSKVEEDPCNESVLRVLHGWLLNCEQHHKCSNEASETLPTRLLDVGHLQATTVRLVTAADTPKGKYIALSHCWGHGHPLVLTKNVLHSFRVSISLVDLPATCRDAVEICRRLGLQYLWIDSLCIIQDDPEDWAREAKLMGTVYHNAHLTISAARATCDTEGFLQKRLSPVEVTWIDMIDEHGAVSQLAAAVDSYENPLHGLSLNEECESGSRFIAQDEPISKRAWTMQERYLSRRKLFFCCDQIYWECQLVTKSEDGLDNFLTHEFYLDKLFTRAQGYGVWYRLISDYSLCGLTYESDIFPALSGLVSRIAKGTAADMATSYCAGLWTDDISNGLSWSLRSNPRATAHDRAIPQDSMYRTSDRYTYKPICYQAPSFSWASWRTRIYYWDSLKWHHFDLRKRKKSNKFVQYVDHCLTPMPGGDSVNGPFQDGWLRLVGVLLPVVTLQRDQMPRYDEPLQIAVSTEGLIFMILGYLDDPESEVTSMDVNKLFVLPLHCDDSFYPDLALNFLIVQKNERVVNGMPTMSRVGVGSSIVEPEYETPHKGEMESYDSFFDRMFNQGSELSQAREAALKQLLADEGQVEIILI